MLLQFSSSGATFTAMQAIQVYMVRHRLSQKEFGDLTGVSQGMVWQWLNGIRQISPERAAIIERRTGGKLKRRQLRPDVFGKVAA